MEKGGIDIVGFRRLQTRQEEPMKRFDQHLMNIVIVSCGASQQEKIKLKEIEAWVRQNDKSEAVRMWRVTKHQALLHTYKDLFTNPLPTYFVTCMPMEHMSNQPVQQLYAQLSQNTGLDLQQLREQAQLNLRRMRFIIFKDSIEQLDKRNYFHQGVHLITSQTALVTRELEEVMQATKFSSVKSSSSINTEDMRQFQEAKVQTVQAFGGGLNQQMSPSKMMKSDPNFQAIKMLKSTPGVGTYNIH